MHNFGDVQAHLQRNYSHVKDDPPPKKSATISKGRYPVIGKQFEVIRRWQQVTEILRSGPSCLGVANVPHILNWRQPRSKRRCDGMKVEPGAWGSGGCFGQGIKQETLR